MKGKDKDGAKGGGWVLPPSSQPRAFISIQALHLTAAASRHFEVQRLTGRRGQVSLAVIASP
jgi:hypothetical protein